MAGREHDPEIGVEHCGKESDGRGRQDTYAPDIDTRTGETSDDGRLEEFAAGASITPDHSDGATPLRRCERTDVAQDMRRRDREVKGQLGGEIGIGKPAHTVCAEESTHHSAPSLDQYLDIDRAGGRHTGNMTMPRSVAPGHR